MEDVVKKIYNYSLEEIMSKRFGAYSKYIIQDRAIPDVRDGLKPVQRRILYAMKKDNNTYDKKFKKCANAVGIVLGHYHPHGDSSVYDALIRLSQDWKQTHILVEVYGNNGSIDGDAVAAYRYTECRLAKISEEVLGDIEKFDSMKLNFAPNFDDTRYEPTVLPAKFPNLLVNGCTGISAGYATNMPPHNLGEVIDATIKRIDSPNCSLDSILSIVAGPDFPTGGIVEDMEGLRKAYETGKGKIIILCRYEFVKEKGKEKIVINEIPFEVNKQQLVEKIDGIRIDKKIDGIQEVRDESDKDASIRIVIDLKPNANKELIINYLLKNTDLQTTYNFNNVAIVNKRPKQLGILAILDAYIDHQKYITVKSCEWDLEFNKKQYHITEGLVKAISILDDVIKTIRASKNKADAKENLVAKYAFTEVQAEAIVMLQLYKLTNTDVVLLEENMKALEEEMKRLTEIINNSEKLNNEIKKDLRRIKKEYAVPRRTEIRDTLTEIKINAEELIQEEKAIVALSSDGYLKRVSPKSYNSEEETGLKPGDTLLNLYSASTLDRLLIITDLGNYLYIRVHDIPEAKWKDMGKHISNIVTVNPDEKVVSSFIINDATKDIPLITFTRLGMCKKTILASYHVTRASKAMGAIKLKDKDSVVSAVLDNTHILITTQTGNYLAFNTSEIPESGVKTSGVKAISLKDDDVVVNACTYDSIDDYVCVFTDKQTAKRVKLSDLNPTSRAKKGSAIIKKTKTVTYNLKDMKVIDAKDIFLLTNATGIKEIKASEIPIMDKDSTGSVISKTSIERVSLKPTLIDAKNIENKVSVTLTDSTDEFLEQFKL